MSEFDVVLEHVSKTYPGGARAVIDFNAELRHGEFVAMLGPSGCGKTTTLRMIGGLEEVTEGKIFISGKDVTDLPPALRDTSMMFQSFALFPHRTVFQNVEFSLKMKGMEKSARDRRVWEMLEMVGLTSFRDPTAQRSFRRPAAARRLGARADQPADRAPARRAAGIAGFQSAPGDDDRAEKGSARTEHHFHHGHAFAAGGACRSPTRSS